MYERISEKLSHPLLAAVLVIVTAGLVSPSVMAGPLEEIIVTAQKREENLQDVAIAITAVTGDQIRNGSISRYEDLSVAIPNFSFTEAVSGSDQFYVRGVGSGINFGFEQAVGQQVINHPVCIVVGLRYDQQRSESGIFGKFHLRHTRN